MIAKRLHYSGQHACACSRRSRRLPLLLDCLWLACLLTAVEQILQRLRVSFVNQLLHEVRQDGRQLSFELQQAWKDVVVHLLNLLHLHFGRLFV